MAGFFSNILLMCRRAERTPAAKTIFIVVVFCVLMGFNILALKRVHENTLVSLRTYARKIKAARLFQARGLPGQEQTKKSLGEADMDFVFAQFSALTAQKGVALVSARSLEGDRSKRGKTFRRRSAELHLKAKEENLLIFLRSIDELPFFCRVSEMTISSRDETGLDVQLSLDIADNFRFNGEEAVEYLQHRPCVNSSSAFLFHPLFLLAPSFKKQAVAAGGSAQDVAGQLSLVGLIEEEGKNKAVFEDRKTGQTIYAFCNDMIGDLTVTDVSAAGAVLSGGGQCYTYSL